ncbi:iron ABC transporter permease (plasmid) [Devosia neptuniae]|uniref:Iron ABC transporter permease n=1 Tax=Devosia neptuniae TaxID=191302 RepID=A0ABY6C6U4_9HYPH|nr:iron ABC transporter permease [Devosia neptuniae]UXN67974.1 iron ABC transporter permease [Devosia neptuniae]
MSSIIRRLPGIVAASLVSLLLLVFIVVPVGLVLIKSFDNSGPLPHWRLAAITQEALDLLPEADRTASIERWVRESTLSERVKATAVAYELAGFEPTWNTADPFEHQQVAIDTALAALPGAERQAVDVAFPIAHIMLHKRIALAFAVRDKLSTDDFGRLRAATDERYGLANYVAVIADSYLRKAAVNSVTLALISVLTTVSIAYAIVYGLNRGGIANPTLTRNILLLPLVAPPILVATATTMLFGRRGLVTYTLFEQTLGISSADTFNVYGPLGIVIAQTLSFLPTTLIVLDNAMRRQDGRLEEAALMLGAGRLALFRNITLPLSWPGLKRAVVLVFIQSLTDFGNPMILGRDTPVLAGVIYNEITGFQNTPLASAICLWLIVPSLLLYLALEQFGRRKRYVSNDAGTPAEHKQPLAVRVGLTGLAGFFCVLIVAIYLVMTLGSVTRIWGVDWTFTLAYFSPEGLGAGMEGTGYGSRDGGLGEVWNSVRVAAIAAPIGGLLALAIGYVAERLKPPLGDIIGFQALIPAILPGIIFGVGYIIAFNAPFGIKQLSLTGTEAIIVINIMFGNLYVGVLAARAALQRIDQSVDEAAESLGAGMIRRFWEVTLPMLRIAALLGVLYVFIDGLTTLSSIIFLVSGSTDLASVAIFNAASSSNYGYAAAKSVGLLVVSALAMAIVVWVERSTRRAQGLGSGSKQQQQLSVVGAGATF